MQTVRDEDQVHEGDRDWSSEDEAQPGHQHVRGPLHV